MPKELAFLLLFIPLIVIVLFLLRKKDKTPEFRTVKEKWPEVEGLLEKESEVYWKMAVIEADKLVDLALKQKEMRGKDMGERIRFAKSRNFKLGKIWGPHILRNNLVHEAHSTLTKKEAVNAIKTFKEALRIMKVL